MKLTNITYTVLTLIVVVLLVATVAVPVIESSQDSVQPTTEYKNDNVYAQNISKIDGTTKLVYNGSVFTINDGELSTIVSTMLFVSDTCFIYSGSSGVPTIYYVEDGIYSRVMDLSGFSITVNPEDKTIIGSFSKVVDSQTVTTDVDATYNSFAFVKSDSISDYVYVDTNFQPTYYFSDEIYTIQYSGGTSLISTINDVAYINGVKTGTVEIGSTDLSGSTNVKTLSGVTGTAGSSITITDGSNIYYPHWVIVPMSVISVDEGGNPMAKTLLGIIPLILMTIPVMVVARVLTTSNGRD